MNPSLPLTPGQLDQLVKLMQLHGSAMPFEQMLMQIGIPPAEVPSRVQEAINLFRIRATQFNDPRAVETLEALAHNYPQAMQQLANIARIGGTFAEESFDALRRLASYRPSDVVPYLRWLAESGSGFANQAVQLLGELAKNGNEAARNVLTEFSENPSLYGSALAGAARALLAAMTAISTTALIIGASVLVLAGLIGGYIWSQSGDKPVEPGPAMNRNRTEQAKASPTAGGMPCPSPLPRIQHKCPWTPEGYEVNECTTGFCWDGGPQGSLACKQEQSVPNSGRTYTSDLNCNEGYKAERDPCTGVILRCVAQ